MAPKQQQLINVSRLHAARMIANEVNQIISAGKDDDNSLFWKPK